jgi:hypothetical protein
LAEPTIARSAEERGDRLFNIAFDALLLFTVLPLERAITCHFASCAVPLLSEPCGAEKRQRPSVAVLTGYDGVSPV